MSHGLFASRGDDYPPLSRQKRTSRHNISISRIVAQHGRVDIAYIPAGDTICNIVITSHPRCRSQAGMVLPLGNTLSRSSSSCCSCAVHSQHGPEAGAIRHHERTTWPRPLELYTASPLWGRSAAAPSRAVSSSTAYRYELGPGTTMSLACTAWSKSAYHLRPFTPRKLCS